MADLAACYFCGAALDDSLSTVSLGEGPDAPTLTLCAGCTEKLETVLGAVAGTAGSIESADSAATPDSGASPQPAGQSSAQADASTGVESSTEHATSSPEPPDPDAPSDEGSSHAAGATGSDDAAPDQDDTDDEGGRSIVEGDQEISALEYNKVMRLLQNREFPVDREEIVTVAANAYQVARADCDRVIEAAIDRGILEEADGQLVKPD